MIIRNIKESEKIQFNKLATHPLQSWEWGDFRIKTGIEVIRLGLFRENKLVETAQFTIHPIPFTSFTIGYFPKGVIPSGEMLMELVKIGKLKKCIFIKLEPDIIAANSQFLIHNSQFLIRPSPHPLFTKYSWILDLSPDEKTLLANMHPKTRYNIRVAQKHGVTIKEDDSDEAFEKYLDLTFETTRRQKFFAHTHTYHRLMWETMGKSKIARLFTANYKDNGNNIILAAWIVFLFNDILYYPYGASSGKFRNTMASNLLMWEVIRFGKKQGARQFDMWGALGPNPSPDDPWIGFNRFKEGYGPTLIEFAGSFDLIIFPIFYRLYNLLYFFRQIFLKIKSNL